MLMASVLFSFEQSNKHQFFDLTASFCLEVSAAFLTLDDLSEISVMLVTPIRLPRVMLCPVENDLEDCSQLQYILDLEHSEFSL